MDVVMPQRISSFLCHAQATHLAGASIGRARSLVPGLHVGDQVDHAVAVSHLIVVPGGRRRVKEIAIWLLVVLPGHKLDKSL